MTAGGNPPNAVPHPPSGGDSRPRSRGGPFAGATRSDTKRLEAFSDGVFAIAITLLVLGLDIPGGLTDGEVWPAIAAQGDQFLSAGISFAIIGIYWAAHHTTFTRIDRGSGLLTVVNLAHLATIVFLPFPTLVLAEYSDTFTGVAMYAATLSLAGYTSAGLTWVAWRQGLMEPGTQRDEVIGRLAGMVSTPVVFTLSIAVATVSPAAATWFWLLAFVAARPVAAMVRRILTKAPTTGPDA